MSFQRFWFFSLFLVLALSSSGFAATVARGGIFGKVVDGDTGESLVGVVLRLDPVGNVAFSDVNGSYLFANLEPGQYSIVAVLDGFSNAQVNGVEVKPGESTKADVQMGLAAFHNTMVVTAETSEASDLSLLKHRQKSVSVSDAIGAEMISKSGGGSAADAVSKITGASVVGGKYLFVRGLGGALHQHPPQWRGIAHGRSRREGLSGRFISLRHPGKGGSHQELHTGQARQFFRRHRGHWYPGLPSEFSVAGWWLHGLRHGGHRK